MKKPEQTLKASGRIQRTYLIGRTQTALHAAQRLRVPGMSFGGGTGPISMPSKVAEACAPDSGPLVNLTEATCTVLQSCLESPDRLNESANLMVNTGLRLRRRRAQLFVTGVNRVNLHSIYTLSWRWKQSAANFGRSN